MPETNNDQNAAAALPERAAQQQSDGPKAPDDTAIFWSGPAGVDGPDPRDWLVAIVDGSEDAIVSKDLNGIIQTWNSGAQRLFGYRANEVIGKSITILIPEDRLDEEPAIISRIQQGNRVEHFETRRRRKDGSLVDISLTISPIRNAKGVIVGASKIARNISEKRIAEEQQQLLMGEMRHRVKNLFALATAIVSISARSASETEEVVRTIQARLSSLARAHELTMTDILNESGGRSGVELRSLIGTLLEPYASEERIRIEGDDLEVGGKAISNIALLVHELATNAAKYGALSSAEGRLDVDIRRNGEEIRLIWRETGGPEPSPTKEQGFGSRLERGLATSLGAEILRDWQPTGLVVTVRLSAGSLAS